MITVHALNRVILGLLVFTVWIAAHHQRAQVDPSGSSIACACTQAGHACDCGTHCPCVSDSQTPPDVPEAPAPHRSDWRALSPAPTIAALPPLSPMPRIHAVRAPQTVTLDPGRRAEARLCIWRT